jgi:hypothetical protein
MITLIPSLEIYSVLFVQVVPVLIVILTWDLAFAKKRT